MEFDAQPARMIAVHADRGHRQDVEQSGIDVGQHDAVGERYHRPRGERRADREHGSDEEQVAVRARRNDDFLEDQLEHVGEGLQQPQRADAIGADAHLHPADDLALGQRQVGDAEDQRDRDGDDLGQRPHHRPGRPEEARDGLQQAVHQAGSTTIGPNMGPSVLVAGCARSDAHAAVRHARVGDDLQHRLAAALAHAHGGAVIRRCAISPASPDYPRRRCPRIAGLLQRRRAPDQRVGRIDGNVGDALEVAWRGAQGFDAHVREIGQLRGQPRRDVVACGQLGTNVVDALEIEPGQVEHGAQHAQHFPRRPRCRRAAAPHRRKSARAPRN